MMRSAERLDVSQKVVHAPDMRRTYPSRQPSGDGYVRKLWRTCPSWDMARMPDDRPYDIERIKNVLRDATAKGARFSQRSLGKEAGEGRDVVGDIINDRNKNPTTKVLGNLARALGGDLSLFGLAEPQPHHAVLPTEDVLRELLNEALQGKLPARLDRRAAFLAQFLAQRLRLPAGQQPTALGAVAPVDPEEGVPPPGPTS